MKSSFCFFAAAICFLVFFTGCKKNPDTFLIATEYPEFSFTYNGQTYTGMSNCVLLLSGDGRLEGFVINKKDIFGGKIYYYSQPANCAFLQPTANLIAKNFPGCSLTNADGSPIDLSRIFIYQSGSISTVYTNCKHKTDPFTNIEYDECIVIGSFSLVIGNNSGQTKNITGSFKFVGIRR